MHSQSHNKMEVGPSHLAVISAFILSEKYLLKVKKKKKKDPRLDKAYPRIQPDF